ncbi:hypothetical protein BC939DRAFT_217053 [Gamsiella multidivaricata]|uniref:uncharacterized protein n=1 Tax=Gamsiella multidivaricata TaxID=101098 RepID=UPI002220F921|nr:uncharacterized protein BC939DRAFT_217053 [Gamsiella multidivaricata]KAI7820769.1 hypothetical protein BC939DRAFT_217053 [Gamsiella multidivaricata]
MDPQQQQHQHAHLANAAAWQVPPHPAYMTATPPMQHPQQAAQQHPAYHQYQQHPGMMEQQHYPLSHAPHHMSVAPPVGVHAQGYGMPPHEPPRGAGSGGRRSPAPYRGSYRDRSYSPPPRHRRTPSPRGGYRDSRGYDRDMDYRGHDRGYDRGYDRSDRGYDRGHSRYDRGYDRGYDRDYDRGYGGRSYGHRARSPPRRSRTVLRGTKEDRLASKTLYVGNIPYSFREPEVEEMFKRFGTIVKVTVVLDQYTGRNKG